MLSRKKRRRILIAAVCAVTLIVGYVLPERGVLPVQGATVADWDPASFWYEPWGPSGVHKGIDIFAPQGTPALAATGGIVTYAGSKLLGGKIVLILGPKWRLHYYAHLDSIDVHAFQVVNRGKKIGTVGDSGNAKGKPHHLHYVIRTPFPVPGNYHTGTQGYKRMFFFDPAERFHAWGAL